MNQKKIAGYARAILLIMIGSLTALAQGNAIYDVIPNPLAGNYPSQPFQAAQAAELGDRAAFIIPGRALTTVTVTMSSWACQTGHWTIGCVTAPGATFTHPITLNLYNVGAGNSVGSLITSITQ